MNKENKDDILKMAQEENKGMDFVEMEAGKHDATIAVLIACIVASVVLIVDAAMQKRLNYGVITVISSINATAWICKAMRNHSKIYIFCSAAWFFAFICWLIGWLVSLVR